MHQCPSNTTEDYQLLIERFECAIPFLDFTATYTIGVHNDLARMELIHQESAQPFGYMTINADRTVSMTPILSDSVEDKRRLRLVSFITAMRTGRNKDGGRVLSMLAESKGESS